jgi:hypothetical protein
LMARAFLFFDGQVQSLAHTHVGSSPTVGPLFWTNFWLFAFLRLRSDIRSPFLVFSLCSCSTGRMSHRASDAPQGQAPPLVLPAPAPAQSACCTTPFHTRRSGRVGR